MEPNINLDQVIVLAHMLDIYGASIIGLAVSPSFVSGWHTLRIGLIGPRTYKGYVSFNIVFLYLLVFSDLQTK